VIDFWINAPSTTRKCPIADAFCNLRKGTAAYTPALGR
jgi:hypothetical protein